MTRSGTTRTTYPPLTTNPSTTGTARWRQWRNGPCRVEFYLYPTENNDHAPKVGFWCRGCSFTPVNVKTRKYRGIDSSPGEGASLVVPDAYFLRKIERELRNFVRPDFRFMRLCVPDSTSLRDDLSDYGNLDVCLISTPSKSSKLI